MNAQTINSSETNNKLEWRLNGQTIIPNGRNITSLWQQNMASLTILKIDKSYSGKWELYVKLLDSFGKEKIASDSCTVQICGKKFLY